MNFLKIKRTCPTQECQKQLRKIENSLNINPLPEMKIPKTSQGLKIKNSIKSYISRSIELNSTRSHFQLAEKIINYYSDNIEQKNSEMCCPNGNYCLNQRIPSIINAFLEKGKPKVEKYTQFIGPLSQGEILPKKSNFIAFTHRDNMISIKNTVCCSEECAKIYEYITFRKLISLKYNSMQACCNSTQSIDFESLPWPHNDEQFDHDKLDTLRNIQNFIINFNSVGERVKYEKKNLAEIRKNYHGYYEELYWRNFIDFKRSHTLPFDKKKNLYLE